MSDFPPGSQKTRMLAGLPYHQGRDPVLVEERRVARELVEELDKTTLEEGAKRASIMCQLFGSVQEDSLPWIEKGFKCDFGKYISFGRDVYLNYNVQITDCGFITIGSRVLFGPNVSILGATHPVHFRLRNGTQGAEFGQRITIEDDVWLGAGCMVLGGTTIGRGSVVGAGAVVNRDVEPLSIVAGVPARLIRKLPEEPSPEEVAAHTVV